MVQLLWAGIVEQLLVWAKLPVTVTPENFIAVDPEFVIVTDLAGLVVPTVCGPKFNTPVGENSR
jgi:hypothetical protein